MSSVRQSFFTACNCTYQVAQYNDQLVHLALQEAYCKPILAYGIAAMTLNVEQMRILNCCWNSVYRHIFGFNKWESVRSFICGLGRLDFYHIVLHCRAKFYKHLNDVNNPVINVLYSTYRFSEHVKDAALSLAQLPYTVLRLHLYYNDFRRRSTL